MQTRIGIINFVLDQAGLDSSFTAKLRGWMNIVTQKLGADYNYRWYNKVATPDVAFISGQSSYPLPTDFQKADTVYLVNSNGAVGTPIFLVEPYTFDNQNTNASGTPTCALIDTQAMTINFDNTPSATTSSLYRLRYFRQPTQYALDTTQDTVIPDFLDQNVLIQELLRYAYERLDDERFMQKDMEAKQANQLLQRNQYQATDTGQVDLSHLYYKRRWRR